jgi:hypothetical protein
LHHTELDEAVLRVDATIPLNGFELDPEAFATQLKTGRPPGVA